MVNRRDDGMPYPAVAAARRRTAGRRMCRSSGIALHAESRFTSRWYVRQVQRRQACGIRVAVATIAQSRVLDRPHAFRVVIWLMLARPGPGHDLFHGPDLLDVISNLTY
jgi:hypothetical protein